MEQRAELAALARKLLVDLRIQEQMDEYKRLIESDDGMSEALECKRRLESVFETLQATMTGCPQKIEQYNSRAAEVNAKKESITMRQDLVRTQIQLARSKYLPY